MCVLLEQSLTGVVNSRESPFASLTTPPFTECVCVCVFAGTGLQGQAVFQSKLTFRPHSTDSQTHRKMTLSIADRFSKAQVSSPSSLRKNSLFSLLPFNALLRSLSLLSLPSLSLLPSLSTHAPSQKIRVLPAVGLDPESQKKEKIKASRTNFIESCPLFRGSTV